jgi:capsular polysaccharide biosynthesis protein
MDQVNEALTEIYKSSANTLKNIQAKLWVDRRNYITLLFVLAMIMVGLFSYYQYSQRHFVLIGSRQKELNNNLNNDINRLKNLTNRLDAFKSISRSEAISNYTG